MQQAVLNLSTWGIFCSGPQFVNMGHLLQRSSICQHGASSAAVLNLSTWGIFCSSPQFVNMGHLLQRSSICQHGASLSIDGSLCKCLNGYVGNYCERLMEDCSDGYTNGGYRTDEKHWIQPLLAPEAFKVHCQMSQGAGLTQTQLRSSADVDFNRTWQEYRSGFEITDGKDFWLGNDYIHWITSSVISFTLPQPLETAPPQVLMVQLSGGSSKRYQYYYNGFKMADEGDNYAVTYLNGWRNNVTESRKYMVACWPGASINFSTWDKDNDGNELNCAQIYGAGFWFTWDNCTPCNPKGKLSPGQNDRLNIPTESFWTPYLGDWTPEMVLMVLFRK